MKPVGTPSRQAVQTVIAVSLQHHGASFRAAARELRVSTRAAASSCRDERELQRDGCAGAPRRGLSTYVRDGRLCCECNLFETQRSRFRSRRPLPAGKVTIAFETTYAEKKPAGALNVALEVNGATVASNVVPVSAPLLLTANDCLDIGTDLGSPVSRGDFDKAPFAFSGRIAEAKVKYLQ